ncbi:MAG: D-alanyl-D-alanine carboxypeptidase, partial [Actinomycetota bacterium]
LALNGNYAGRDDPERAAAAALTKELESSGVPVAGAPGSGEPPVELSTVASVRSPPLASIVAYMNRTSSNFYAEMLGKRLGAAELEAPGTIAKGARAIEAWVRVNGEQVVAHDSSGLSYENRVSPEVMVKLLGVAASRSWGRRLRADLPAPGMGTLGYRLSGVPVRAKTGSLFNGASALSGWVRATRADRWLEFSILGRGTPTPIEDRVVRIISRARAGLPPRDRPGPACGPTAVDPRDADRGFEPSSSSSAGYRH